MILVAADSEWEYPSLLTPPHDLSREGCVWNYHSRIGDTIYVLHCFKKDNRKTDMRDLEVARARLKEIRQILLDTI
jgi:Phage derived protein Gp49-like (DUF891)